MKPNHYLTAALLLAGSLASAHADAKSDVENAIKKLGANYSWTSTTTRPERPDSARDNNRNRGQAGPTEGKTADGMVLLKSTRGDQTFESLVKGEKVAIKRDGGWEMVGERAGAGSGDGNGGDARRGRGGRGRFLQGMQSPATQAEELLAKVGDLKQDGDAFAGDLSEEAAKEMVSFGGGRTRRGGDAGGADRPDRPQPTDVKATAKFWVKDGVLTKYETVVAGKIKFNEQERDLARTTTVDFSGVGSTKIEIPEALKKDLAPEAAEGAKPAEAKEAAKPEEKAAE